MRKRKRKGKSKSKGGKQTPVTPFLNARPTVVGRSIDDGLDAHVNARQSLTVGGHVCGGSVVGMLVMVVVMLVVLLVVVRVGVRMVGGVGRVGRAEGGGKGAGAAGGRVALSRRGRRGAVCSLVVVTLVHRHGVGAAVATDRVRTAAGARRVVGARRGGAAIRCVELVIYWCQTDAGNPAVVVIPMHWMTARLEALPARCRSRRGLQVLEPIVHTLRTRGTIRLVIQVVRFRETGVGSQIHRTEKSGTRGKSDLPWTRQYSTFLRCA